MPKRISKFFISLLILSWNCNGITYEIPKFRSYFLSKPQFDIVLSNEVKNYVHRYNVPDYILYYTSPLNAGPVGGKAVYLKSPYYSQKYTALRHESHSYSQNQKIHIVSPYIKHVRPTKLQQS